MRRRPQKPTAFNGALRSRRWLYNLLINKHHKRSPRKTRAAPATSLLARHLPEDRLPEILRHLPVKSLLRFRCVSKPWLALVDDDANFARSHLKTFKNNRDETRLFLVEGVKKDCVARCAHTFETVSDLNLDRGWKVVSSVDGLLLLSWVGKPNVLELWNPSLLMFREVPPILSMDPYTGSRVIGMGYDPMAKDYKIVMLVHRFERGTDDSLGVGIYMVGADSWKITPFQGEGPPYWEEDFLVSGNAYLEGSLYFAVSNFDTWDFLSFDLSNEVFSCIRMPWEHDEYYFRYIRFLIVDGGSSVAVYSYGDNDSIWVLEKETMSWTERLSWSIRYRGLLYCTNNGNMYFLVEDQHSADEMASYVLEKNGYSPN